MSEVFLNHQTWWGESICPEGLKFLYSYAPLNSSNLVLSTKM